MTRLLCVDGLNAPHQFGMTNKLWVISDLKRRIDDFITAAKNSDVTLVVFLDAGKETADAAQTWRDRVSAKVLGEALDCAPSMQILAGEMFRSFGVAVYYSTSAIDCDHAIAAYAHWHGGDVLSRDHDFFSYTGRNYRVYESFWLTRDGRLQLVPRDDEPDCPLEPRSIVPLHELVPRLVDCAQTANFEEVMSKRTYSRGMATSMIKVLGNPHARLVDLRRAVYAKMPPPLAITAVTETWPEWDAVQRAACWPTKTVEPSHEFDNLFDLPVDVLFKRYFGDQKRPPLQDITDAEWENHVLACKLILCEIYSAMTGRPLLDLLADQMAAEKKRISWPNGAFDQVEKKCVRYKANGQCWYRQECYNASGHRRCPFGDKCRRGDENCLFFHEKRMDAELCRFRTSLPTTVPAVAMPATTTTTTNAKYIPPHRRNLAGDGSCGGGRGGDNKDKGNNNRNNNNNNNDDDDDNDSSE